MKSWQAIYTSCLVEGGREKNILQHTSLTLKAIQPIIRVSILIYGKELNPLLLRYARTETGKTVVQAEIYTRDDHGITRDVIDPDAYMITRRLRQLDYEAYIVGGAVRDFLIGRTPKDFDIATNATPRQLKKIFPRSRIIGRRFRLVHVYFKNNRIIEVATFRSGEQGDPNDFGTLDEDVRRRDYSLNALYYCPRDEYIIDHVGGYKDIKNKRLVPVIPETEIFVEDPVRMIRGVKYAVFAKVKIPRTHIRLMKKSAHLLSAVSPSRLTEEFFKIALSGEMSLVLKELMATKVLTTFLPGLNKFLTKGPKPLVQECWRQIQVMDDLIQNGLELTRAEAVKTLISVHLKEAGYHLRKEPGEFVEIKSYLKGIFEPVVFSNKELELSVDTLFHEWGLIPPKKKKRMRKRPIRPRQRGKRKAAEI